jgi:geranylgeranyl diphosphate synthase, type I
MMPVRPGQEVRPVEVGVVLERVHGLLAPRLHAAVGRLATSIREVVGYHFGWYGEKEPPPSDSARRLLRPALTLLCAEAVGGSVEHAMDAAIAIELVHNFSLLHDDVIDWDARRRTVWSQFGAPAAILGGNALLTLAVEILAETPHGTPGSVSTLCTALQETFGGAMQDVELEQRADITIERRLALAGGKTAALLRCACELGAVHGGGTPTHASALRRFGWHLGVAFRLVDDLLGIWGDPDTTGKPSLSDLRTRRRTLPVVAAMTSGGAYGQRLAELYLRPEPLGEQDLATAAALVEMAGGRAWAQTEAERHLRAALDGLTAASLVPRARDTLVAIAALVTGPGQARVDHAGSAGLPSAHGY